MKHFLAWLMVCFLFFTPNIVSHNSNYYINNTVQKSGNHTPSIGPKIYYSNLIYTPGANTAKIEYGLIIGQGETNEASNTLVNAAITTNNKIPGNNTTWNDVSGIINKTYSTTGNWTANGSITFDDPAGNGSTDIYEGTINLKNLPDLIEGDYYLIVQAHGAFGTQYTTYDMRPINYSNLKEPSKIGFSQTSVSVTTTTLEFRYNPGEDPYSDPWLIDETNTKLVVTNLNEKNNYTIDYDRVNGIVTINFTNLDSDTEYKAELILKLINPVKATDVITLNDEITFNTKKAPTIVSVQTSEIRLDSVKISWNIEDTDNTVSSIKIAGTDVDEDVTAIGLQGEIVIKDLTPNIEYNDWKLIVGYEADSLGIETNIDSFITTLKAPTIKSVKVEKNELNSIKVNWNIEDIDSTIIAIKIVGTYVDQDVTAIGLQGETIIESLDANKTYDDWKLIVTYNNGVQNQIEQQIDSFNILELNSKNNIFPWWWIVLALILLLLLIIIIILIIWKRKKDENKEEIPNTIK